MELNSEEGELKKRNASKDDTLNRQFAWPDRDQHLNSTSVICTLIAAPSVFKLKRFKLICTD